MSLAETARRVAPLLYAMQERELERRRQERLDDGPHASKASPESALRRVVPDVETAGRGDLSGTAA